MGYRGKLAERARARELRAESWTLLEIAGELGVSKSSVSTWVCDVDFVPRPRNRGHPAGPHLDLEAAVRHWSELTGIQAGQFQKPYRAVVDETLRHNRHEYGCARIVYSDTSVHRRVMAKIRALGSSLADPG